MINPYQLPAADLETNTKTSKRWWKVFFFFILALEILSLALSINDYLEGKYDINEIISFIIYIFILIGLYGFAFNKQIFFKKTWQIQTPIYLIYDIIHIISSSSEIPLSDNETMKLLIVLILILSPILILQYYALFKYAYGSNNIWKNEI